MRKASTEEKTKITEAEPAGAGAPDQAHGGGSEERTAPCPPGTGLLSTHSHTHQTVGFYTNMASNLSSQPSKPQRAHDGSCSNMSQSGGRTTDTAGSFPLKPSLNWFAFSFKRSTWADLRRSILPYHMSNHTFLLLSEQSRLSLFLNPVQHQRIPEETWLSTRANWAGQTKASPSNKMAEMVSNSLSI